MMLNKTCNKELWSEEALEYFYFTNSEIHCFQDFNLTIVPCAFLWMLSPFYYYYHLRQISRRRSHAQERQCRVTTLLVAKIAVLIAITVILVIRFSLKQLSIYKTPRNPSFVLMLSTLLLSLSITIIDFRHRVLSSCLQFWFWAILFVSSCAKILVPIMLNGFLIAENITFLYIFLIFLQFVLHCFAEKTTDDCLSPEEMEGYLDRLRFSWLNDTIYTKVKKEKTSVTLPRIRKDLDIRESVSEFESRLRNCSGLTYAVFACNVVPVALGAVFLFLNGVVTIVNPLILKALIQNVADSTEPLWRGYVYALSLFLANLLQTTLINQYFHLCYLVSLRVRSVIFSSIFRKTLKTSDGSKHVGKITNLMAIDADNIFQAIPILHYLWYSPLLIGSCLYLMCREVQDGEFIVIIILSVFLINILNVNLLKKFVIRQLSFKDKRIHLLSEVIKNIKVLKLYAWETIFMSRVDSTRAKEIDNIKRQGYVTGIMYTTFATTTFFIIFAIIGSAYLFHKTFFLKAENLFLYISYIEYIRVPLQMIPDCVTKFLLFLVSKRRILEFLNSHDNCIFDNKAGQKRSAIDRVGEVNISGSFCQDGKVALLKNIDLKVEAKSFVIVAGPCGSGKSTLLSSIIGEIPQSKGSRLVNGKLAYLSQQPWVQNMTIRENILFGDALDECRYERVLKLCALKEDLKVLPDGDFTVIGENGTNFSGGQKQRISIARTVYKNSDIYILDDPFSALDVKVSDMVFNNMFGIKGHLKSKTCILVTNNVKYYKYADKILIMKDGRIADNDTYARLVEKKIIFDARHADEINGESDAPDKNAIDEVDYIYENADERISFGSINWTSYHEYLKSIKMSNSLIILVSFAVGNFLPVLTNMTLSKWTEYSRDSSSQLLYFKLFTILGFFTLVYEVLKNIFYAHSYTRAAMILHKKLLEKIIHCPMRFFNENPAGRIMNRFSSDMAVVDDKIPEYLHDFMLCLFRVVSIIFLIIYTTPGLVIVIIPLILLYLALQQVFVRTTRQLKRLESAARSPIFICFNEIIHGGPIIRSFDVKEQVTSRFFKIVNKHLKASYCGLVGFCWLSVRTEFIGSIIVLLTSLFSISNKDSLGPSFVGMLLSYVLTLSTTLSWKVRILCKLDISSVSLERIHNYITEETEKVHGVLEIPKSWPQKGAVEFRNYEVRYKDASPLILKSINVKIERNEKIGVCGRTGAGKSSLALCLFRLLEASHGKIIIDGLDISFLGLHDLRQRLSIIPQDPTLFKGTIRSNLDPSMDKTDEEIWFALCHARIDKVIKRYSKGLDQEIDGENFAMSIGQRQLLCLARVLLKRNRILVMDEATAALDVETDVTIQSVIKTEFCDCTVITIAHRLDTIMNSDKILLLDNGIVVEYGPPEELLINSSSLFYNFAKSSGIFN